MVGRYGEFRSIVGAVLVLVVPLAAGTTLAVWALSASPLKSGAPVAPLIAQVQSAARDNSSTTSVTVVPAGERVVKSQTSGLVTQTVFAVGQPIDHGDIAMRVDGLPVISYVAASPLYRDVSGGMSGSDVSTAQHLLNAMGYLDVVDGVAGPKTVAAIRAFNADTGRGSANSVLSTNSLLWIPRGGDVPQAVMVQVGDEIAPQTPLFTTAVGSTSITVETERSEVARTLMVGTAMVPLAAGVTSITDPGDVATLLEQMGDQASAVATVSDAELTQVGTVPASAVIVDAAGGACYFTGPDGEGEPVKIRVTTGTTGVVDVDPELIGTAVLVNPRETRSDLSCDS